MYVYLYICMNIWEDIHIKQKKKNLIFQAHHLTKNHQIYCFNKLNSKEIYTILTESGASESYSRLYYHFFFQNSNLDWKATYVLPLIVTNNSRLKIFLYKLLHNGLYLNKILFSFGKTDSSLFFFCKIVDETPFHLFYKCTNPKLFRDQFKEIIFNTTLSISSITPQSVIIGDIDFSDNYLLINHLIVIYKFCTYNFKKDPSILRNGVLSLRTSFKRCKSRGTWVRGRGILF